MKVEFSLNEDDFLEYQLYIASKSKSIQNKRRLIKLLIPLFYLAISMWKFIQEDGIILPSLLMLFALLWFIFYPKYSKHYYKKHYKRFIDENYKERFLKPIELEINEDQIRSQDYIGESKINPNEVNSLIELKTRFLLKLNSNASLIIPKKHLTDVNSFKEAFIKLEIPIVNEFNWSWK